MAEALALNPAITGLLLLQTPSLSSSLAAGANDNLLQIEGLQTGFDHIYINDAEVSATVLDAEGLEIDGLDWPASLVYVAESAGCYRLLLPAELNLIAGQYYTIQVGAEKDGLSANWERCIKAETRR